MLFNSFSALPISRKYLGLLVHTSDSKALRAVEEAPCWAGAKAAAPATRAERAASLNMVVLLLGRKVEWNIELAAAVAVLRHC